MSISWDTAWGPTLLVLQEVWPIRRSTELRVRKQCLSSYNKRVEMPVILKGDGNVCQMCSSGYPQPLDYLTGALLFSGEIEYRPLLSRADHPLAEGKQNRVKHREPTVSLLPLPRALGVYCPYATSYKSTGKMKEIKLSLVKITNSYSQI